MAPHRPGHKKSAALIPRVALFFIAIAVVLSGLALRSRLVVDEVAFQTKGQFSVTCGSSAGLLDLAFWLHHFNWIDLGSYGEYHADNYVYHHLDSGVMHNCELRSADGALSCDLWARARDGKNTFHLFGLAAKFTWTPIVVIRIFVPYWMPIAIAWTGGLLLWFRKRHHIRNSDEVRTFACPSCGYDLRGTPTMASSVMRRCSECGSDVAEDGNGSE